MFEAITNYGNCGKHIEEEVMGKKKSAVVSGMGLGLGMLTLADQVRRELGISDERFHRLASETGRENWQRLFEGMREETGSHLIECDVDPFVPDDWIVVEHQLGGQFEWNLDEIELYLCEEQQDGSIEGHKLRKKLEGEPVLNANVLDYLLEHPELIPDEWKGKWVFFWGTIYRGSGGDLRVRCLGWSGDRWDWSADWLGHAWNDGSPALLLCSSALGK